MHDLMVEIKRNMKLLTNAQREFRDRGIEYANQKREYDMALQKRILILKDQGFAATLIEKLAKGSEDVAELSFKLASAEVLYRSADKAIDVYKKNITVLNDQINREMSRKDAG